MTEFSDITSINLQKTCIEGKQELFTKAYTIYYIYEGSLELPSKGYKYRAFPGDCLFIPPYTRTHINAFAPARVLKVSFSAAIFIHTLFKIPGVHFPWLIPPKSICKEIEAILVSMVRGAAISPESRRLFLISQLISIAGIISRETDISVPGIQMPSFWLAANAQNTGAQRTAASTLPRRCRRLSEVLLYLKENCTLGTPLSEAARELGLTPQYLSSLIKESFNETYHEITAHLQAVLGFQYLSYAKLSFEKTARLTGLGTVKALDTALEKYFGKYWQTKAKAIEEIEAIKETGGIEEADDIKEAGGIKETGTIKETGAIDKGSTAKNTGRHAADKSKPLAINVPPKACPPLVPVWNMLVNLGSCQNFKDENFCRQLNEAQKSFHFTYGRIYGFFNDTLFTALDLCCQEHMLPLIALEDCTEQDIHRLPSILKACTLRYGPDYVCRWRFEINIGASNSAAYVQAFKKIYHAIKYIFPDILVGGPGIKLEADTTRLDKIIGWLDKENMLPDFITIHQITAADKAISASQGFISCCRSVFKCLKKYRLHEAVWLTQYGPLSGQYNTANDSDPAGHFICHMLMAGCLQLKAMGYGALSDISPENRGDPGNIFTGEGGLITWNGLFKSGYYVLDFFRQLGPYLLYRDKRRLITASENKNIQILAFCTEDSFFEELSFYGMAAGIYIVKQFYVNSYDGNIYEHWRQLGSPREPAPQELEMMKLMAHPKCCVFTVAVENDESLSLPLSIDPWEIHLCLIEKKKGETPDNAI